MLHDDLSSRVNYRDDIGTEQHLISSDGAPATCQGLPSSSFSLGPPSYRCPSSMVLQGLTEPNPQLGCSPYDGRSMNYPTSLNYHVNSNEFSSSSWSKFPPQFLKDSPPKQQQANQLHFSNNTPFWNATAEPMTDIKSNFYPNQFLAPVFDGKPNCSNFAAKVWTTIFLLIYIQHTHTYSIYSFHIKCLWDWFNVGNFFFFFCLFSRPWKNFTSPAQLWRKAVVNRRTKSQEMKHLRNYQLLRYPIDSNCLSMDCKLCFFGHGWEFPAFFEGPKREIRGQNHYAPAISLAFRKGELPTWPFTFTKATVTNSSISITV